ncbi:class I lanthipeptide [Flavobacterium amniphilum]|uniref:class I lanthipeptide n=1 Tax=Flavobacterium amniphilum TaxID=1834035 RepID=UPI002029F104|nr:class I lanthipeptide [Flavobacterium amniphilum]MCL9807406.1 class I lanthipeptide [Flavobacterium amniphilum]
MKSKKTYGSLVFNKSVVTELDNQALASVSGGTSYLTVVGPISVFTIILMDIGVDAE